MCSELECGICYRSYNTGRRCPLELQCKHSFCESCLVILSRPSVCEMESTKEKTMVCPLCRYPTSISGEVKGALRVDEEILEHIVRAGVLEGNTTDDEDTEENEPNTFPDTSAEETDTSSHYRGGRFRRSLRRIWCKFTGNALYNQRRGGAHCMTDEDLLDLATMSCYII